MTFTKNTIKILIIILACIIAFLCLFRLTINYLTGYMETNHFGEIILSDEYSVHKIHADCSVISSSNQDGVYIGDNVLAVGWNKRYILYKTETSCGYIDMEENKKVTIRDEDLKDIIEKFSSYGEISMKDVYDLYPETGGLNP